MLTTLQRTGLDEQLRQVQPGDRAVEHQVRVCVHEVGTDDPVDVANGNHVSDAGCEGSSSEQERTGRREKEEEIRCHSDHRLQWRPAQRSKQGLDFWNLRLRRTQGPGPLGTSRAESPSTVGRFH